MIRPDEPKNEKERLKELELYSILDTLPEEDYDNITAIASETCDTHISLVSLIDDRRQWFKSHHGLGVSETPKEYAFCAHAINDPYEIFIIQDARKDERFHDNPLVIGEPYVIFYAGIPLVSENGLPLGTLCVIDHSPKQLSDKQINSLRALSRQVMNLLELRKKKIQLEEALKTLEQRNQELEQFAFIAAHDIKSPLNSISNLANALIKEYGSQLDDDGQKMIEFMESSSVKLKKLVEGLLEYSRCEKVLKEKKSIVSLNELKNDIETLFIGDNKCNIVLNTKLIEVVTHKTALEQIFITLVSNAIKYNDKDIAQLEIGASENGLKYEFYVQDNGPGVPVEHHEKIFRIFEVAATKNRPVCDSNGIGLAKVKRMIKAQGGTIRVDSKNGDGARFTFTIEK